MAGYQKRQTMVNVPLISGILSVLLLHHVVAPETVHLGFLLPLTGSYYGSELGKAITLIIQPAIQDVYEQGLLSLDWNITYTIKDSACHQTIAVGKTSELQHADCFIGPACSPACVSAGLLASYWNKPMISYSCSSVELSDRKFFPTFAGTQPFSRAFMLDTPNLLYEAMRFFHWKRAAIISTEDHVWSPIAASTNHLLRSNNVSVPFTGIYAPSSTFNYKAFLKQITNQARVVFLLAFSNELAKLLIAAKELGMMNGEYAFTTLDFTIETRWANESWAGGRSLTDLLAIFDGLINLSVKEPHGDKFKEYSQQVNETIGANNIKETPVTFQWAAYIHDAISLYAIGLNRSVSRGGNKSDGLSIISNITDAGILFTGVSGGVAISHDGNRVPVFVFSNRQNGTWVTKAEIDQTKPENESIKIYNITTVWPGGTTTVPLDEPKCGFQGEKCALQEKVEGINYQWFLMLLILLLLIIGFLLGFLYYRKRVYERDLTDTQSWIISYKDIVLYRPGSRISGKAKSRACSFISSVGGDVNITNIGRYKGELVALKRLKKEHIDLKREVLVEMKQVRDLIHSNVNPYIGICIDAPSICLVSIFCNRSSLQVGKQH